MEVWEVSDRHSGRWCTQSEKPCLCLSVPILADLESERETVVGRLSRAWLKDSKPQASSPSLFFSFSSVHFLSDTGPCKRSRVRPYILVRSPSVLPSRQVAKVTQMISFLVPTGAGGGYFMENAAGQPGRTCMAESRRKHWMGWPPLRLWQLSALAGPGSQGLPAGSPSTQQKLRVNPIGTRGWNFVARQEPRARAAFDSRACRNRLAVVSGLCRIH